VAIKKKPKVKSKGQLFLERVEIIDAIVPNKLIEQRQWRELAKSITANMEGEKVQSSSSQSKLADAVARCIDMEGEILQAVENLIAEKGKVIATMEKLDNPIEYKILHMRYIQYIELNDIADMLHMEYTNVTTTHGRACKHIQAILDGKEIV
jgi:DNA-directed RNA polymerase specialized sigma24 family protein